MNLNIRIFIKIFVVFCLTSGLFAQEPLKDTTEILKTFTVNAQRLEDFGAGIKSLQFDSATQSRYVHSSLSDLIASEAGIFVRSYHNGGIASASFRGTNASHTAVIWNGFNINNPMNGQMDLSLIPVSFTDGIKIQYGGAGALWGSGAVGGAIHLSAKPRFNEGVKTELSAAAGSFESYSTNLSVGYSKSKHESSIKYFYNTSENNFSYINNYLPDAPKLKQEHARFEGRGLYATHHRLINNNQRLNLFVWYQQIQREIPPTLLESISLAQQKDNNIRVSSEWAKYINNNSLFFRVAYFDDAQNYENPLSNTDARNDYRTFAAEIEKNIIWKRHKINTGSSNSYISAIASNYQNSHNRLTNTIFASYSYESKNERFSYVLSGRQEWIDMKSLPFTYSTGADYRLFNNLLVFAQFSKVFRVPSLNDLFWQPGGNQNLEPESGYTLQAGFNWTVDKGNFTVETMPTFFNSIIDNWILWLPVAGYWRPQNLMQVWSRGLETNTSVTAKFQQLTACLSLMTNYVLATSQKAISDSDASVGKQLLYTPMYNGFAKFDVFYKSWHLSYKHNYTGYRYVSSDNTQYLKPYHKADIHLSYNIDIKKVSTSFFIQCHNLWNEVYEVVAIRPMPLRHFRTGITLSFNNPEL